MGFSDQLKTLKDNWLIAVIVIVLVLMLSSGPSLLSLSTLKSANYLSSDRTYSGSYDSGDTFSSSIVSEGSYRKSGSQGGEFAPEVSERKVIKSATLGAKVERGEFSEAESQLKKIVSDSDSLIVYENVYSYDNGASEYITGSYNLMVDSSKYEDVVSKLKGIGEVDRFTESSQDVTGNFVNLEEELKAERERLSRYKQMLTEATTVDEKLTISDRIFYQERTIGYLENSLQNLGERIDYTSISVSLNEEISEYADIAFVKLSALVMSFIGSLNSLISFVVWILPWVVLIWLIRFIWRRLGKKGKRR